MRYSPLSERMLKVNIVVTIFLCTINRKNFCYPEHQTDKAQSTS